MKLPNIILAVVGLHLGVIGLLLFQPGCQSQQSAPSEPQIYPAPSDTTVGEGVAAPTETPLDPAFNAGLSEPDPRPYRMRSAPQRPEMETFDAMSASEDFNAPLSAQQVIEPEVREALQPESTYAVQKGDSLWSIAQHHGVGLDALLGANGLSKNALIHPGQMLVIPAVVGQTQPAVAAKDAPARSSGRTYVVRPGDSLSRIARMNGTDVKTLQALNHITDPRKLRVGQELILPEGASAASPAVETEKPALRKIPAGEGLVYKVQRGDNLSAIARKFGVPLRELMELNGITDPSKLRTGQDLLIKRMADKQFVPRAQEARSIQSVQEPSQLASPEVDLDALEDIPVVEVESSDAP